MQAQKLQLFFSYSRADGDFALKLATDLRAAGTDLWMDQLDIRAGDRWDRAVEEALETCPCLLVILSPSSVASNNVMDEVSLALEENKKVVPVRYGDCEIPFRLRRLQYIDFTHDYDASLARLVETLAAYASEASSPAKEAGGAAKSEPQRVEGVSTAVHPPAGRAPAYFPAAERGAPGGKQSRGFPGRQVLVASVGLAVALGVALIAYRAVASPPKAETPVQSADAKDQAPPPVTPLDVSNVKYLNREGYTQFRAKRFDDAIATLTKAVTLQPDNQLANLNLAKALCSAERFSEAQRVMKKAMDLNPRLVQTARGDGEFARVCKPIVSDVYPAKYSN